MIAYKTAEEVWPGRHRRHGDVSMTLMTLTTCLAKVAEAMKSLPGQTINGQAIEANNGTLNSIMRIISTPLKATRTKSKVINIILTSKFLQTMVNIQYGLLLIEPLFAGWGSFEGGGKDSDKCTERERERERENWRS